MGYVSTWPNAKIIGKQSIYEDSSNSIELPELRVEKSVEERVEKSVEERVATSNATENAPKVEVLSEEQSTAGNPVVVEVKCEANDQTPTKDVNTVGTLYYCLFSFHLSIQYQHITIIVTIIVFDIHIHNFDISLIHLFYFNI